MMKRVKKIVKMHCMPYGNNVITLNLSVLSHVFIASPEFNTAQCFKSVSILCVSKLTIV